MSSGRLSAIVKAAQRRAAAVWRSGPMALGCAAAVRLHPPLQLDMWLWRWTDQGLEGAAATCCAVSPIWQWWTSLVAPWPPTHAHSAVSPLSKPSAKPQSRWPLPSPPRRPWAACASPSAWAPLARCDPDRRHASHGSVWQRGGCNPWLTSSHAQPASTLLADHERGCARRLHPARSALPRGEPGSRARGGDADPAAVPPPLLPPPAAAPPPPTLPPRPALRTCRTRWRRRACPRWVQGGC